MVAGYGILRAFIMSNLTNVGWLGTQDGIMVKVRDVRKRGLVNYELQQPVSARHVAMQS